MRKMKIQAKVLNLHQAYGDAVEIDLMNFKGELIDTDGKVLPEGAKALKTHKRGPTIADTFHVQVGVIVDGSLKYSISDIAKKNPTKERINTLLKKAANEYKATLLSAGETVPDIDIQLQE